MPQLSWFRADTETGGLIRFSTDIVPDEITVWQANTFVNETGYACTHCSSSHLLHYRPPYYLFRTSTSAFSSQPPGISDTQVSQIPRYLVFGSFIFEL